jgi:putative transposase
MRRITVDSEVEWRSKQWIVESIVDLEKVKLRRRDGAQIRIVPVADIQKKDIPTGRPPIAHMPQRQQDRAQRIYNAIEPLISLPRMKREQVEEAAEKIGCVPSAIYGYLRTWHKHKRISAFARKKRADIGRSRLDNKVQQVIHEIIESYYKTEERRDVNATLEQIRTECNKLGLKPPSLTPVRSAIRSLPQRERAKARFGNKHARERYEPYRGSFPGADYPLAVYQIDHTPADVILVDEETRKPIGRATLTIVLDVCSRMLAGFCISLEAPSAMTAALALSHAILPKENWLKERKLDGAKWPIWGTPTKVHADNAKEFRGTALTRGCAEYGITLENRPKGQPQYGGNVERSFRTFMVATQRLKGTTFSNVAKKLEYDSVGKAIMTVAEYEKWFAIYITYRYHHKKQRGIDHPPINFFEKLIKGSDTHPPIGLPEAINDPRRLLMDFLPFTTRTIQQDGVAFEKIQYWDDVLRKWLGAKDLTDPKEGRKFIFAYDPRDLSTLYFLDPDSNEYFPIPYRNRAHPPMSIWELAAAQKWLAEDPTRKTNESMIFQGVERMRSLEASAEIQTNKTRRTSARKKHWGSTQQAAAKENNRPPKGVPTNSTDQMQSTGAPEGYLDSDEIEMPTFDDLDWGHQS